MVRLMPLYSAEKLSNKSGVVPGEEKAFFMSTVYHSIDHYTAELYIKPERFYTTNSWARDKQMAELIRIVRTGFIPKPTVFGLTTSMKYSNDPFFKDVYTFARTIDQEFADQLDTCITR